jgi:hypothetical protein
LNKPLTPFTEKQKTLIVNNVIAAVNDINKLNGTGYKFLYLSSGFIAHNNRFGFADFYTRESLRDDIIANASANMWRNFRPGQEHYEYMMSNADVYKRILARLGVAEPTNNWIW